MTNTSTLHKKGGRERKKGKEAQKREEGRKDGRKKGRLRVESNTL